MVKIKANTTIMPVFYKKVFKAEDGKMEGNYFGEMKDKNTAHGRGILIEANTKTDAKPLERNLYYGFFEDNLKHGYGRLICYDGTEKVGEWEKGELKAPPVPDGGNPDDAGDPKGPGRRTRVKKPAGAKAGGNADKPKAGEDEPEKIES